MRFIERGKKLGVNCVLLKNDNLYTKLADNSSKPLLVNSFDWIGHGNIKRRYETSVLSIIQSRQFGSKHAVTDTKHDMKKHTPCV